MEAIIISFIKISYNSSLPTHLAIDYYGNRWYYKYENNVEI